MKLFVSYSRDDKNFVYELVEKLKNEGEHYVWIDRDLTGGQLWWDSILDNIDICECFIPILTPHYIGSANCITELNYALALDKVVLPLRLKPCERPEALQKIQDIDISALSLNETFFRSARALFNIEKSLFKQGYAPQARATRPPMPVAKVDAPENAYELFAAAESAAAENNMAKAETLFGKVMRADPKGLGVAAAERLTRIIRQRDCAVAYMSIVQMVEKNLLEGARAAWHDYIKKYGPDHDPNNYNTIFSETAKPQEIVAAPLTGTSLTISDERDFQAQLELREQLVENTISLPIMRASLENAPALRDLPVTIIAKDGKAMRLIPASKFLYGKGELRELPDFYIDEWPVTNAEYQRFILENNLNPPSSWRRGKFPDKKTNHPVTGVSCYEAMAYARWAGKRLPTAAEWEKAARGADGRRYPWGEGFDIQCCNTSESGQRATTPVTQYQAGASIYGVLDMAGNVWEWTADETKLRGLGRQSQETKHLLKGGSWNAPKGAAECASSASALSSEQSEENGFRCALSIESLPSSILLESNG